MSAGLEGVVVAETELSEIDGAAGSLRVRGWPIGELSLAAGFEGCLGLLLDGQLPDAARTEALRQALAAGREAAWQQRALLEPLWRRREPMQALAAGLASLELEGELALAGAAALIVGGWSRTQRGLAPIAPDANQSQAADLLRLRDGEAPSAARAEALGRYLTTVADHGMNASTFTARVVASTGSDACAAVVAAVGALKGPLHGGAPGPVLDMLDAVGAPDRAEDWVAAELAAGRRLMGFGHRVYRVRDPRAAVLEQALATLIACEPDPARQARLALAEAVERAATAALAARYPERPMAANVEFATALLLEALGLERALFPAVFACGRIAGWLAHVAEQQRSGRLIRPKARYVGPAQP